MNRRYDAIHGGNIRSGGARVLEKGRPRHPGDHGSDPGKHRHTPEQYRIPIPAGREEEARAVARRLAEGRASVGH